MPNNPTANNFNGGGLTAYAEFLGVDPTNTADLVGKVIGGDLANQITVEQVLNYGASFNPVPEVLYNGNYPVLLALETSNNTVNTSSMSQLEVIIQADADLLPSSLPSSAIGTTTLTVTGARSVDIYLGDLGVALPTGNGGFANGGAYPGDNFHLVLNDTGNDQVYGGNDDGDTVYAGGGQDHIVLGTGTGDQLYAGTGNHQFLEANGSHAYIAAPGPNSGDYITLDGGSGFGDLILGGAGRYDTLIGSTGGSDTIVEGTGKDQTAIAMAANDTLTGGSGVGCWGPARKCIC